MKTKWYTSIVILILALFGAVTQHQTTVPNQEIVFQFTNASAVTSQDTQNAIASVKKQLQDLGVSNIQVKETESGKLVIAYYTEADVASIKETFLKAKNLALDFTFNNNEKEPSNFPFDENTNAYNIDVYEIKKDAGNGWDLNGIAVIELKSESHRFLNPNFYAFFNAAEWHEHIDKVASKIDGDVDIAIHNTSHKIPEVRAGPLA